MKRLAAGWRNLFDVRPGEYRRTVFMSLYLLFVLFAYYVLKSVSEAMFLNKFDIDKLPNLYIYMAIFGGALAYVYSKAAARASLHTAVTWTMFVSFATLVLLWFPLRSRNPTMVYTFAIWVRLFSVVTVTQGWVVASNLFTPREAKRLYGLLGMGMIVGAILGGEYTAQLVRVIGTNNLLFASAPLVLMAYGCYLVAVSGVKSTMRERAAESEHEDFSFRDIAGDIGRSRHLQVLVMLMAFQFIVDTLIDYQFKLEAKSAFKGDELTAFLGRFYGRYLNICELVLQFFFTSALVKRLGVGGTMQIMPLSLAGASLVTLSTPSTFTTSTARLVEASTRYTLARTGNELFYMPLPLQLRNRIKAFIDIFMDRAARGISGFMLLLCVRWSIGVRGIALLTFCMAIPWMFLTVRAHREYVRTLRRRLESRALDIGSSRITVEDDETVRMLEQTAQSSNSRQAVYGLSLLAESPGYDIQPLLVQLAGSAAPEVRAQVYALARSTKTNALVDRALAEIDRGESPDATRQAVAYILAASPEHRDRAQAWLEDPNRAIREGVVEYLGAHPEDSTVSEEWIARAAADPDWTHRVVAARLGATTPAQAADTLHKLLTDGEPHVVQAACGAAGVLKNRSHVFLIVKHLADYRLRGAAIEALTQYGASICGTLGDMLQDQKAPLQIRRNIPKVLKRIPHQNSVDVLLGAYKFEEPAIRAEALKGLSRLRANVSGLTFEDPLLQQYMFKEVYAYYELVSDLAALEPYRDRKYPAVSLLAKTIQSRIDQNVDRLFRLLALRYPPREMYLTYLALVKNDKEKHSAAVELLDTTLDQDFKRVILPMFDAPERRVQSGQSLFGIERRDAAGTLRSLMHSEDPWLAACAIGGIAELKLQSLAKDVAKVAGHRNADVSQIAAQTAAALAG